MDAKSLSNLRAPRNRGLDRKPSATSPRTRAEVDDASVSRAISETGARVSSLAVLISRAEARALLWQAGELDLHEAVDELQAAAEESGLIAELGQDAVQAIIAEAFEAVR
jgi:hypothetical protein